MQSGGVSPYDVLVHELLRFGQDVDKYGESAFETFRLLTQ